MATFSSEGEHSQFHVSIYSWDDMEIEYPIRSGGDDVSTPERKEVGTEAVDIAIALSHRSPAAIRVRGKDKVRRRRRQTESDAETRGILISTIFSADEREYDTSQLSHFRSEKPFLDIRIPAKPLSFHVELPSAAVRGYGHQVADHIFLKIPNCGDHWKIELRTSPRRDRMWLEKGWEEFASFYLLDQGDMATFSSEGEHSRFHVSIYSRDDMEIEYPICSGGADFSTAESHEIGTEAVAVASSLPPRTPAAVRVRGIMWAII